MLFRTQRRQQDQSILPTTLAAYCSPDSTQYIGFSWIAPGERSTTVRITLFGRQSHEVVLAPLLPSWGETQAARFTIYKPLPTRALLLKISPFALAIVREHQQDPEILRRFQRLCVPGQRKLMEPLHSKDFLALLTVLQSTPSGVLSFSADAF